MTPRGAAVSYVKYQITITFTRLPEAHDSLIWAETTYYGPGVTDVVCLFCGQFAELMVFAVQYWRKWNGIMWCLLFLFRASSVSRPGSVQSGTTWNILKSTSEEHCFIGENALAFHPPLCVGSHLIRFPFMIDQPLVLSVMFLTAI